MNLAICVECGEQITEKDEMLPDYPGLYQCPKCGHPNGDVQEVWVNNTILGGPPIVIRYSTIKGFMPLEKGQSKIS